MHTEDLRFLIGRKQVKVSQAARSLARWSVGAVVATRVFRNIKVPGGGHGLFVSLNNDARAGLACLAQVPVVFPLILFVFALYLNYGSLYVSVRQTLVGTENSFGINVERGVLVNSLMGGLPRWWRRWHIFGWWLVAGLSGAVTTAIASALLNTSWNAWLIWAMVVIAGWCVVKLEEALTVRRFQKIKSLQPAEQEVALQRAKEWLQYHPGDTSAMPLIYIHSGLSTAEIQEEFSELGTSGLTGFTSKVLCLVIVVLFYALLPAPDVSRFQNEGLSGCFFSIVHGFAGVAEENLVPSIIAALVLLVLMPISFLIAYLRFMIRYHFPLGAMRQVLLRETPFAIRMRVYSILMISVLALVIALLMWGSAVVAVRWNSPVAGIILLLLPIGIIVWAIQRSKVRGHVPQ